jgi:hypothetical protein
MLYGIHSNGIHRKAPEPLQMNIDKIITHRAAPVIKTVADAAGLRLQAAINLSMLPPDFANSALTLALSCVVEGRDGSKSFWALNHPPEKPDFHHDDCFQLQIGAALRS